MEGTKWGEVGGTKWGGVEGTKWGRVEGTKWGGVEVEGSKYALSCPGSTHRTSIILFYCTLESSLPL